MSEVLEKPGRLVCGDARCRHVDRALRRCSEALTVTGDRVVQLQGAVPRVELGLELTNEAVERGGSDGAERPGLRITWLDEAKVVPCELPICQTAVS